MELVLVGIIALIVGAGGGVYWGRRSLLQRQELEGQSALVKASNEAKTLS